MTRRLRLAVLSLSGLLAAVPAMAEQQKFKLINKSGYTLVRFYATPSNTDDWGRDIFGDATLASGYSSYVTVPGNSSQCVYDFKMIFSDDDVVVDTINLCQTATYTIN